MYIRRSTWASPPVVAVLGWAHLGMARSVHTVVYSKPTHAVPGLSEYCECGVSYIPVRVQYLTKSDAKMRTRVITKILYEYTGV